MTSLAISLLLGVSLGYLVPSKSSNGASRTTTHKLLSSRIGQNLTNLLCGFTYGLVLRVSFSA